MSNEPAESGELIAKLTAETLEIEQFRSLRAEILRGTEDGNQVMTYGLAAIGIVITASVAEKNSTLGFVLMAVLVPGFSSLVLSLWFGTLERVARASYFITGIEFRLKSSINAVNLPTWDLWLRGRQPHRRGRKDRSHHFWTTEYSGFGLFLFLVITPLILSWEVDSGKLGMALKISVTSGVALIEIIFVIWMLKRLARWKQWLLQTFEDDPAPPIQHGRG